MKYLGKIRLGRKLIYRLRLIVHRVKGFPSIDSKLVANGLNGLHVSAFNYGNSGDIILPVVLRELFERFIPMASWRSLHVSEPITEERIEWINSFDFVVIGGGGLFISDSNKNFVSGWQWNISTDMLKQITVPFVVFAVGYNQFRDQSKFPAYFDENIRTLHEKSVFFGLRNHGSIKKVKNHIGDVDIELQSCMTTVVNRLYDNRYRVEQNDKRGIAVNIALDRPELRGLSQKVLNNLAQMIYRLSLLDEILYVVHVPNDRLFLPYLDLHNVKYSIHEPWSPASMLKLYARVKLAVGMRGHAQMVPFGVGTPIISLISHDKMMFFLEDNGLTKYGVEINDVGLVAKVENLTREILSDYDSHTDAVDKAQEQIWKKTFTNMQNISKIVTHKVKA